MNSWSKFFIKKNKVWEFDGSRGGTEKVEAAKSTNELQDHKIASK